jgi:hypothetical protein
MHKQQSNQNYPSSLRSCWKEASGQNVQGHGDGRVKIGQFGRHKRSWHNFSADEMKLREMGSCLEPGKQKERESGQAWMLEECVDGGERLNWLTDVVNISPRAELHSPKRI